MSKAFTEEDAEGGTRVMARAGRARLSGGPATKVLKLSATTFDQTAQLLTILR